jgi:hypothetical protein
MAISQISPNIPAPKPAQTKEVEKQPNQGTVASATDQKQVQKAKTDTVTISKQAAQMTSQLYSPQEEAKETATQKATESAQGKK